MSYFIRSIESSHKRWSLFAIFEILRCLPLARDMSVQKSWFGTIAALVQRDIKWLLKVNCSSSIDRPRPKYKRHMVYTGNEHILFRIKILPGCMDSRQIFTKRLYCDTGSILIFRHLVGWGHTKFSCSATYDWKKNFRNNENLGDLHRSPEQCPQFFYFQRWEISDSIT